MICVEIECLAADAPKAPRPPILGESETQVGADECGSRGCLNPSCVGGNVVLAVSRRLAVCPSCDGAGGYGTVRENRERYYRGRNTALLLAMQSGGILDAAAGRPEIEAPGITVDEVPAQMW